MNMENIIVNFFVS